MVEDKRAAQSLRDRFSHPHGSFQLFSLSRGSKIMTDDVYKKQIGGDHYLVCLYKLVNLSTRTTFRLPKAML